MLTYLRCAVLFVTAVIFTNPAVAAPVSASPTAKARLRLARPLSLASTRDLEFGTVMADVSLAGEDLVWINNTGSVFTCGLTGKLTCSGLHQPARFAVKGVPNTVVIIRRSNSKLINTTSGGGELIDFAPSSMPDRLTLDNSGDGAFGKGGTIFMGPANVEGLYVGNMTVTVDYQ